MFDAAGPLAGSVLVFAGQVAYQEVLPLFHPGGHLPDQRRSPLIAQRLGSSFSPTDYR